MAEQGGCLCGAIRFEVREGAQPVHHALCHCRDCQRASGAPATSWSLFEKDDVTITGEPASYRSSEHALRQFCSTCGTSLFYLNDQIFPGQIDIQSATFDNPGCLSGARANPDRRTDRLDGKSRRPAQFRSLSGLIGCLAVTPQQSGRER